MKTITVPSLRTAALAAALLLLPAIASAKDSAAPDRAVEILRATGRLPVAAAGPYVEVGTYRIQVSVKLGRASLALPDGTWLYEGFSPENSAARGTLVLRFTAGRVSELYLATPAVVAALRDAPNPAAGQSLVASHARH